MDHNCQHLSQVRPMSNVEIGEEGNCLNLLTVYKKKFVKKDKPNKNACFLLLITEKIQGRSKSF